MNATTSLTPAGRPRRFWLTEPPSPKGPLQEAQLLRLDWPEYLDLDRVNITSLKNLGRSPAHYLHAKQVRPPMDTDAWKVGRAVHAATLEPQEYKRRFITYDGGRRSGKEWEEFRDSHVGRDILTVSETLQVSALAQAVRSHPIAGPLVADGQREVTALWTHHEAAVGDLPGFDALCKGRLDFIGSGGIIDLKTTKDASPEGFARESWRYGYHLQAAFYVDAVKAALGTVLPYTLLAVEKTPPFVVSVFRVPDHIIELGSEGYRALLNRWRLCTAEGRWPGYVEGVTELSLPPWAVDLNDDDFSDTGITFGEDEAPKDEAANDDGNPTAQANGDW